MGVSTDAILFYGIPFDEKDNFPWDEDDNEGRDGMEFEDFYRKSLGYVSTSGYENTKEFNSKLWAVEKNDREEFDKEHPQFMEVVYYCSGEYPMYALAIKGTVKTCYRGDAVEINPIDLVVEDCKKNALIDFCNKHNIKMPTDPKWFTVSYWG